MNQLDTMKSIRKTYGFNPSTRPHSSKKGKKGYGRKDRRQSKMDCRDY